MTSFLPEELTDLDDMVHFISLISDWSFALGDTSEMSEAEISHAVFLAQEQALHSGIESLRAKKLDLIKQKKAEFERLSMERTRMDSKLLHLNESARKKKLEYSKNLEEYVKYNLELAYNESKIELKNNDISSKTATVENILDFKTDNINCKREEMQALVDEYRDCREEFQQYQQDMVEKTDTVRKEVLVTTTLCKRAQTAVVTEIRKSAPNANQNTHNKFLQLNIADIGERTVSSRDDLRSYCVNKIMEMRRNDRIALEREEEALKRRLAELNNPELNTKNDLQNEQNNEEGQSESDSDEDFLNAPAKMEAERRASMLLQQPDGATNANDTNTIANVSNNINDIKGGKGKGKNEKGQKKVAEKVEKKKATFQKSKAPLLTTANYLSNFIDTNSAQYDNLLSFLEDCGEMENNYSRLLAIKQGLEGHVIQQACVLTSAVSYFRSNGFDLDPNPKKAPRHNASEYANLIHFGHVEDVIDDFVTQSTKARFKENKDRRSAGSPSRGSANPSAAAHTDAGSKPATSKVVKGGGGGQNKKPESPSNKSGKNMGINDVSVLGSIDSSFEQGSSEVVESKSKKPTIQEILHMDVENTRSTIGYNHDEIESMNLVNLQELFKETENINREIKQTNDRILTKLSAKKLLDLQQYEEWLAAHDKGRFSFFGDDGNIETPRAYFTTETERRMFDVPLEEDGNWRSKVKASTKTKEVPVEKSIKSALRKGNGFRSFIKVLFESAGVNFDRNAGVKYNTKGGNKGKEAPDITDLNIEAGLVKLSSVMDTFGYQFRMFLEQSKQQGSDKREAKVDAAAANIATENDSYHDPKLMSRKLSISNLSYI